MRLIDADALMEELSKWLKEVDPTHPSENYALLPIEEDIIVSTLMTIEEQPTIDTVPERKKGKWIHDGYDSFPNGIDWIHCSKCGKRWINIPADLPKYCPCCGARMEGAEE